MKVNEQMGVSLRAVVASLIHANFVVLQKSKRSRSPVIFLVIQFRLGVSAPLPLL